MIIILMLFIQVADMTLPVMAVNLNNDFTIVLGVSQTQPSSEYKSLENFFNTRKKLETHWYEVSDVNSELVLKNHPKWKK